MNIRHEMERKAQVQSLAFRSASDVASEVAADLEMLAALLEVSVDHGFLPGSEVAQSMKNAPSFIAGLLRERAERLHLAEQNAIAESSLIRDGKTDELVSSLRSKLEEAGHPVPAELAC